MTVSSAPIGNTGQSLDGFVAPINFRESVVITDPNDQFGISTVVSTQPLTGYAIPVWIQGTPNFSSTVNITSTVNVTSNLSGTISSFAVNFIPGTTMVNVVSTVPQTLNISQVSTFPIGTTSTQIISSIPFFVAQSSAPWTMNGAVSVSSQSQLGGTSQVFGAVSTQIVSSIPIFVSQSTSPWTVVLPGTTMVNVVSTVPQSITIGTVSTFPLGTTSTQIVSSIPIFVSQSTSPWVISSAPIALTGTSFVNVVSTVTQNVNLTSSIPIFVSQSTNPWVISSAPIALTGTSFVNVVSTVIQSVNIVSTITQTVTGNVSTFPTGVASVTAIPTTGGGLIPFIKIGVTTASVQIKSGAGKLHDIAFTNNATSTRWLKFYNASSAAVGTTAPFMVFGMPGNTTGAQPIAGWIASAMGYGFSSNIFVAATASSATSTDTSAPASGDIVLNVGYI